MLSEPSIIELTRKMYSISSRKKNAFEVLRFDFKGTQLNIDFFFEISITEKNA